MTGRHAWLLVLGLALALGSYIYLGTFTNSAVAAGLIAWVGGYLVAHAINAPDNDTAEDGTP